MTDAHAYIRVSSRTQRYATQRAGIDTYATGARLNLTGEYVETRTATKVAARPELDRLLADVRAGRVRCVVVFELSRLTRLGIRDTLDTLHALTDAGCTLHFASGGLPAVDPNVTGIPAALRDMLFAALAVAAQIEGMNRSERTSAARERIEAEGGQWGRPKRGHTKRDTERGIQPVDLVKMRRLRDAGESIRRIAELTGTPRATVARCLKKVTQEEERGRSIETAFAP